MISVPSLNPNSLISSITPEELVVLSVFIRTYLGRPTCLDNSARHKKKSRYDTNYTKNAHCNWIHCTNSIIIITVNERWYFSPSFEEILFDLLLLVWQIFANSFLCRNTERVIDPLALKLLPNSMSYTNTSAVWYNSYRRYRSC